MFYQECTKMRIICFFLAMFVLLGCGYIFVDYFLFSSSQSVQNLRLSEATTKTQMKRIPANILILSVGRSGSSFLGEIFKRRNDGKTRYVFEPLRKIIPYVFIADNLKFKAINVIHELFKCRNSSNKMGNKHFKKESRPWTCFRDRNVVVKELTNRFPENGSSSVLENLLQHSKSWNMRIIHLVRDPRHVIPSMQRLGWIITENATSQEEQIHSYCKSVWRNLKYGREHYAQLKVRYKLVVFRNMMTNPYRAAKTLYEFAGMGAVPSSVFAWIKTSTNGKGDYHSERYSFTTTRNTTKILSRKIAMTNKTNDFVQKHCGDIISFIQELYD